MDGYPITRDFPLFPCENEISRNPTGYHLDQIILTKAWNEP